MRSSEVRPLSVRRPLRDVANNIGGGRFSKSGNDATAKKDKEGVPRPRPRPRVSSLEHPNDNDDVFDRLLLLQTDLSALVRQVDELVVQAFQLNSTTKQGRTEVESFSHVLSEMLSSLKPWVPRFQRAISSCSSEPENQIETHSVNKSKSVSVVNEAEPESPESSGKPNPDMLISPSPLVSWRANCSTEGAPQLFLLTPLPISKGLSSKRQDPPKSVLERVTSDATKKLFSFNSISIDPKCNLVVTESSTPMMFSKSKSSIVVMTPCLKRSPPKSCVLLEDISESSHRPHVGVGVRKSTPFPIGHNKNCSDSDTSESSSGSEASDDNIALKYPELLGIQLARKSTVTKKKMIEESPDWFRSPPKSCVLIEPLNEQTLGNNNNNSKEPLDELVESTPLWKESRSQRGKCPGENTLKKELWTKFEAASSRDLSFINVSVLGGASQKGFLDRLDEVSCDGED